MFQKILVAIDRTELSHDVFDLAVELAQATHASLMLLIVFSAFEEGYIYPPTD